jgi:hypothetical protein
MRRLLIMPELIRIMDTVILIRITTAVRTWGSDLGQLSTTAATTVASIAAALGAAVSAGNNFSP